MDSNKVDTGVGSDETFSLSMDDNEVTVDDGRGVETPEPGSDATLDDTDAEARKAVEGEQPDDEDGGDNEGDGEALEDLGAFDANDTAAWDERYVDAESGTLNEEALSAEFFGNEEEGLNEGTYDYLASKGISREMAKKVEQLYADQKKAAETQVQQDDLKLFEVAGGPDPLREALAWGKGGGYSKAAQKRFNEVMKSGDMEAKQEAVELLMARFDKTSNQQPRRQTKARRDATKGGGSRQSTIKPFSNRAEVRKARKDAGGNQQKLQQIARRLAVSKFD